MGLFEKILMIVNEKDSSLLREFPQELVEDEGKNQFDRGDIYFTEQLAKKFDFKDDLDLHAVEQRIYQALERGRVDDFCFLFDILHNKIELDSTKIHAGYHSLLSKGYVSGLEVVIKKTKILPELDISSVKNAFNVLIASARIEAIDYVRQLSNISPEFSDYSVQLGFKSALHSSRYALIPKIESLSGKKPHYSESEVHMAFQKSSQEHDFKGLFLLSKVLSQPFDISSEYFVAQIETIIAKKSYNQLPFLLSLSQFTLEELVPEEVAKKCFLVYDSNSLVELYNHSGNTDLKIKFQDHAYSVAVSECDFNLLTSLVNITDIVIKSEDSEKLMNSALLSGEKDNVRLIMTYAEGTCPFDSHLAHSFLFKLYEQRDHESDYYSQLFQDTFSIEYDAIVGKFVNAIHQGNMSQITDLYQSHQAIQNEVPWANEVYTIVRKMNHE